MRATDHDARHTTIGRMERPSDSTLDEMAMMVSVVVASFKVV